MDFGDKKAEKIVLVVNEKGLHLKPAQNIVNVASKFQSHILLGRDGQMVDAKSTLGLLALGAPKGTRLRIEAFGEDAAEAINALAGLFERAFGETGEES
ncbi:MAG: HPr family phosphocarrier protein [Deltaproteobacteria bacterium]|nr:HPr family phosphocarrier protein [Deltaproteobacteria bacterium]